MRSQAVDVRDETRRPPPLIAKPPATVEVAPVPVRARADVWRDEEKEEVPVPRTLRSPVVVAVPEIVRPPEAEPLPIVVEAEEMMPVVNPTSVEVETPYEVAVNGKAAWSFVRVT